MRKTTLAAIAAEAGVSLPTVSKVVNGRPDVSPATRARVEQLLDRHQYPRSGPRLQPAFRPHRPGVQRPGQPVGGGDPARRRGVGRAQGTAVAVSSVRHGDARPTSWTSTIASHDSDGVILVITKVTEAQVGQLRGAGDTARRHRPGQHAARGHPVRRRDQLGGRVRGHRAPALPRPPADRRDHRARRLPVQPGQARRLPVGPGAGRRRLRPGARSVRRLPPRGRIQLRGRAARPAGAGRRRSSRAATSRPSASTRPPASAGCASLRTCPSSASTSCPSLAGPRRP